MHRIARAIGTSPLAHARADASYGAGVVRTNLQNIWGGLTHISSERTYVHACVRESEVNSFWGCRVKDIVDYFNEDADSPKHAVKDPIESKSHA